MGHRDLLFSVTQPISTTAELRAHHTRSVRRTSGFRSNAVVLTEPINSRMVGDSETIPAPCGSSSDVGGHLAVKSANRKPTPQSSAGAARGRKSAPKATPKDWRKHGNAVKLSLDLLRST